MTISYNVKLLLCVLMGFSTVSYLEIHRVKDLVSTFYNSIDYQFIINTLIKTALIKFIRTEISLQNFIKIYLSSASLVLLCKVFL